MKTQSRFNEYIESVLAGVRFNEAHSELKKELLTHLEDAKELTIGLTISEDEIEAQVIRRMGNATELGKTLNEIHRPKVDFLLLGLVGFLLAIGSFAMFQSGHIGLHLLWLIIGIAPLVAFVFLKPSVIRDRGWVIYAFTVAICGLAVFFGRWYEGQPYLSLGLVSIKIVDLSVVLFVMGMAGPFSKAASKNLANQLTVLGGAFVPLIAYSWIGSFYPAALLMVASLAMMIASKSSRIMILGYSLVGTVLVALSIKNGTFVASSAYPDAITSEGHTDFVFSSLSDHSSILAAMTAAVCVAMITYLSSVGKTVKSVYGRTISSGAVAVIAVGIAWGLFSNMGFIPMPTSGVYFPFLSYSGSLMIGHMALIGLILGIQRRKNLHFV